LLLLSALPLAGEGYGGGSLGNGSSNRFKNGDAIGRHVVIAETKDPKPSGLNHRRTSRVGALGLIGEMLSTFEFDDQLCCVTCKVGDVIFDRDLASETYAVQPVIAEFGPEDSFSVSGVSSEFARS
jgi:hypothetical protein